MGLPQALWKQSKMLQTSVLQRGQAIAISDLRCTQPAQALSFYDLLRHMLTHASTERGTAGESRDSFR